MLFSTIHSNAWLLFLLQSIYSVPEELEDEADRVFEKYAQTQCKNMMYQARPNAIKYYYREIIKSPKSDAFACAKLLTFEEYIQCKPDWFTEEAWESLCKYWCSAEYLKRRKLGQDSRKKKPDGTQNRGGSRPLVETQQYLVISFLTIHFWITLNFSKALTLVTSFMPWGKQSMDLGRAL